MSAINWLPFLASRSEYTRGDALGFDTVFGAVGSLTPKHFWGFLYSFMTSIPFPGTESDISMRGLYFGAVAVVLAVVCLVWVRQWIVGALAALTIGSLLMALGGAFFLRIAIHMALPIFNMSRFPAADSRYLGVLALCVLAGGGALAATAERAQASDFAQRAFRVLLVFYVVSLVGLQWILGKPIDFVISAVTFDAVCMLLALLVVHRYQGATAVLLLCGIAVLETGYCVTANFDLAGQAISGPGYLALSQHERGFPKDGILGPRLGRDPHLNEDTSSAYVGKKFFLTDYNPLRLRRLFALLDRGFGPWLKEGPRVVALPAGSSPDSFATFSSLAKPVRFSITGFGPNQMDYEVDLDSDALLVFNEMYFPGWKATVDSQTARVKPIAEGLRSLSVSAGHHKLVFKFRPILFFVALGISLTGVLVFFAWFVRVWRRRAVTAAA
jgi:hypothetical protein